MGVRILQVSLLSPLLFKIFIDGIPSLFRSQHSMVNIRDTTTSSHSHMLVLISLHWDSDSVYIVIKIDIPTYK